MESKSAYEVKITRKLLEADPETMTEVEKTAVEQWKADIKKREEQLAEAVERLRKDCPIVTSGLEKDLIPAYGWIQPVSDMAYRLEKLNLFYAKHGMKVVFDQTKEKFGTFRGYWNIVSERTGVVGKLGRALGRAARALGSLDFRFERVEDEKEQFRLFWQECDEKAYSGRLDQFGRPVEISKEFTCADNAVNVVTGAEPPKVVYFKKDADGRFYRSGWSYRAAVGHLEPRRFKLLFRLKNAIGSLSASLRLPSEQSGAVNVLRENFELEVSDAVRRCKRECDDVCISCGAQIGEHGISHRCRTQGWILYKCRKCAGADGRYYDCQTNEYMDGYDKAEDGNGRN